MVEETQKIIKRLPILLNNAKIIIDRNKSNDCIVITTTEGILVVYEYSDKFEFKDCAYQCENAFKVIKDIIKETI